MNEESRHTDRWLPLLGCALILEALLCFTPRISSPGRTDTPGLGSAGLTLFWGCNALLPGLLGVLSLATRRWAVNGTALARLAMATLLGVELVSIYWIFGGSSGVLQAFHPISWLLIGTTAPLLWGTALARRQQPGDLRLRKLGRIFAGLIQLGFVPQFIARIGTWDLYGIMEARTSSFSAAAGALGWLLQTASDVLLLWATFESVRTAFDENDVRRRAERIHQLMRRWVALAPFSWILFTFSYQNLDLSDVVSYELWRAGLFISVTTTAAFAVARRCRLQFPDPRPPMGRSGGVE
jgi:hypothetical protein